MRFRIVLSQLVIWPASIWGASRGVKNVMSWEFQHLSWDPSHFGNFSHIFNSNPQEKHRKNQQLWNHYLIKWKELACFSYVFLWAFLCVLPFSKRNAHCTFVVRLPNGELATIWSGRIVKGKTRMKKIGSNLDLSNLPAFPPAPATSRWCPDDFGGGRPPPWQARRHRGFFGVWRNGFGLQKNSCFPGGGNGNMGTILGKTMENLGNIGKKHLEKSEKNLESTNG